MTRCPYPVPRHRNFHGTSVIPKISPISSLSHLFALRILIFTWRVHLHPITPYHPQPKKILPTKPNISKKTTKIKTGKNLPIWSSHLKNKIQTSLHKPNQTHLPTPPPKKIGRVLGSKLRLLYNWSVPRFVRQLNGSLDEDDSTSWTTPGRNWPLVTHMGGVNGVILLMTTRNPAISSPVEGTVVEIYHCFTRFTHHRNGGLFEDSWTITSNTPKKKIWAFYGGLH